MAELSRVETIFFGALEQSTPEALEAYLKDACDDDAALRERVEKLLDAHARSSGFLKSQKPPDPSAPTQVAPELDVTIDTLRPNPEADDEAEPPHADLLALLLPATAPNSIGRLGHYDVLEILGSGGFGTVLKGFDDRLHRMVAIKMMAPSLATSSPPRKRFLREARSAAAVRHDNIVNIYAVEDNPLPYLVMEYVAGHTLQERLDAIGPLEIDEVLHLGHQIALGLAAAHAMNIVHRDIKPSNILIENSTEKVKISDFGLARAADDASLTRSGVIMGTPLYMSPEQAKGLTVDYRSDLFSLGSVFYAMCSGRPPFRAPNTVAVLQRLVTDTPRPIPEIIDGIPQWLVDLIAKLQVKEADQRVITAKEVAEAFEQGLYTLKHTGNTGKPAQVTREATEEPPVPRVQAQRASAPRHVEPDRPSTRKTRRKVSYIAAAAVFLGIAGFLLSTVFKDRHDEEYPAQTTPPASTLNPQSKNSASPEALAWEQKVAGLPADQQVAQIAARLTVLNPGFQPSDLSHKIENGLITELAIHAHDVKDISPVRIARDLRAFMALSENLEDLSALSGMKLTTLKLADCLVADLSPLRGMPLQELELRKTKVRDLSPLEGMKFGELDLGNSLVEDYRPLRKVSTPSLHLENQKMPGIKDWGSIAQVRGLRALHIYDPDDACLNAIKAMPLEALAIFAEKQPDLSSLKETKILGISLSCPGGLQLESLKDLPITQLFLDGPVSDLAPLRGMKLDTLSIHTDRCPDLAPLQGTRIAFLAVQTKEPFDVSQLVGLPMNRLHVLAPVKDFSPLAQTSVLYLNIDDVTNEQVVPTLRAATKLETINNKIVNEFWKEYDTKAKN